MCRIIPGLQTVLDNTLHFLLFLDITKWAVDNLTLMFVVYWYSVSSQSSRDSCPLHISRSDAPIGLRCNRRQIGTKPDVASGPHSHWPNGVRTFMSVDTVKESYLLQLPVKDTHVRLPIGRRHRAI